MPPQGRDGDGAPSAALRAGRHQRARPARALPKKQERPAEAGRFESHQTKTSLKTLVNHRGGGIARSGGSWDTSGREADVVLECLSIRPTGNGGLACFKNNAVAALMHHD